MAPELRGGPGASFFFGQSKGVRCFSFCGVRDLTASLFGRLTDCRHFCSDCDLNNYRAEDSLSNEFVGFTNKRFKLEKSALLLVLLRKNKRLKRKTILTSKEEKNFHYRGTKMLAKCHFFDHCSQFCP